jgi:ornithine carbamoyltransferase
MKHFQNLGDLGGAEGLLSLLDVSARMKRERGKSSERPLLGKQVALVFEKASTRTRLSLEVAVSELGGHPIVLTSSGSQMGRGEPLRDTARVLSRMVHAITFRTADESRFREMAEYSSVPVLNALTDQSHPMQLCADLMTVHERFGRLDGLTYCWLGDGNNMAQSWIEAAGILGLTLRLGCPEGYDPGDSWLAAARARGAKIDVVRSPEDAVRGAHVVSTDVFASMGQEAEGARRLADLAKYSLTTALLARAAKDAIVLHCLPAHRGEEIAEEVLEGPHSAVWDQAEARLHTSKALLLFSLGLGGL